MSYKGKKNNNVNFAVTSKYDGSRSFTGHEDRFYKAPTHQRAWDRGGNRNNRGRGGGFRNYNSSSSRFRSNRRGGGDDDESMGEDNRRGRGSFNNRRGLRRGGRYQSGGQSRTPPNLQWYKGIVPNGSRIGQERLFKLIQDNAEMQISFSNYHTMDSRACFFVQGREIAESLRGLSRRIDAPHGGKIVILMNETSPPRSVGISPEHKEKLKVRMSDRYDASTQFLNLDDFGNDEVLNKEGIHLFLNKYNVIEAVVKVVAEYIPEMTGLNLCNNRISGLQGLSGLVKAAPGIVSLNLGENTIRDLQEVEKLKGWTNLVTLNLDGNSLCNAYNSETQYISAVRKIFPKVTKLDGKDLPPPISFDLETLPLPDVQGSYFFNDEIKNLLVNFVKEYYNIFDSDNRQSLMAAYSENAQFSYHWVRNKTIDKNPDFTDFSESRNLKWLQQTDSEKKNKKVKVGALPVVSALEEFPRTTHDLNSFVVDVMLATPQLLSFVLHGVFKETSKADRATIRTFSRTFITVPAGAGVSIINDMLTVSNAGKERSENAFKEGAPTPSSSPASSSQTSVAQPDNPANQKKMVEEFSNQSRMTTEYSLMCLQKNNWNFIQAAKDFQELNSQGKIPPEAFIK